MDTEARTWRNGVGCVRTGLRLCLSAAHGRAGTMLFRAGDAARRRGLRRIHVALLNASARRYDRSAEYAYRVSPPPTKGTVHV